MYHQASSVKGIFWVRSKSYEGTGKGMSVVLSYDVAINQSITSCLRNRMTTRVITLWRVSVTSLTTSMSTRRFIIENNVHFEGNKNQLQRVIRL